MEGGGGRQKAQLAAVLPAAMSRSRGWRIAISSWPAQRGGAGIVPPRTEEEPVVVIGGVLIGLRWLESLYSCCCRVGRRLCSAYYVLAWASL